MHVETPAVEDIYKKYKELRKEDVLSVLDWLHLQPHLPTLTELEVLIFLNACNYSIEASKKVIDLHFTCRTHTPEIFSNRQPNEELQRHMNNMVYYFLPGLTPDGASVGFAGMIDPNPAAYSYIEQHKIFMMVLDLYLMKTGPTNYIVILIDMEGAQMGHLLKMNVTVAKKIAYYMQEAVNFKRKGVYHINAVPWVDKITSFIRPFVKKELLDSLNYYTTEHMDQLYEHIPKKMLPKNYGGEAPTIEEMHESMKKDLIAHAEFFKEEELTRRVNESHRPGKAKNAGEFFGVEGSFKKLDID